MNKERKQLNEQIKFLNDVDYINTVLNNCKNTKTLDRNDLYELNYIQAKLDRWMANGVDNKEALVAVQELNTDIQGILTSITDEKLKKIMKRRISIIKAIKTIRYKYKDTVYKGKIVNDISDSTAVENYTKSESFSSNIKGLLSCLALTLMLMGIFWAVDPMINETTTSENEEIIETMHIVEKEGDTYKVVVNQEETEEMTQKELISRLMIPARQVTSKLCSAIRIICLFIFMIILIRLTICFLVTVVVDGSDLVNLQLRSLCGLFGVNLDEVLNIETNKDKPINKYDRIRVASIMLKNLEAITKDNIYGNKIKLDLGNISISDETKKIIDSLYEALKNRSNHTFCMNDLKVLAEAEMAYTEIYTPETADFIGGTPYIEDMDLEIEQC